MTNIKCPHCGKDVPVEWVCPRCGAINPPEKKECPHCSADPTVYSYNSNGNDITIS